MMSLGSYPDLSLAKAIEKRDDLRKMIVAGIDPSQAKKAQKASDSGADSFETIAREWFEKFSPIWSPSHGERIIRRLERDIFPWIGKRPVNEIKAPELLSVLRRIESRGAVETAHRASQNCGQVFRYAIATGRAERDPSGDLKGAIPPTKTKHHASITDPLEIGKLLRAIDGYSGGLIVRCALRIAPMVFVRPGELRQAEWSEIDFDKAEWVIPGIRMKMKEKHIVPLSRQALEILRELHPLTEESRYIFPSPRTFDRPMSDNAILAALRSMGYTGDMMTGHGFRSMASTLLNEQGWNRDAIERQLAHAERDEIRAAYNYAQHLPERKKMMQAWADYLDSLRKGADVIPFRKAAD
jgi:integrase